MHVLDDSSGLYGKITEIDPNSEASKATCDKLFDVGEAVKVDVGEVMLERQRVLYLGALRAAKVLLELAGEEPEIDQDVVTEYEETIKSREYAGREDYSLDRVEEIVNSSMAYSEDYYEFLRTDGECKFRYDLHILRNSSLSLVDRQQSSPSRSWIESLLPSNRGVRCSTCWEKKKRSSSSSMHTLVNQSGESASLSSPTFAIPKILESVPQPRFHLLQVMSARSGYSRNS